MNRMSNPPPIIVVLGMHRSGSSLVTHLLSKLSVHLGEDLLPARTDNPDGFFENRMFLNLHERMLEATGNTWYAPSRSIDTDMLLGTFGAEARQLVAFMDEQGGTWAWKDPRTPIFLDFWSEILKDRDVRYLVTNRHPGSISASLQKRDNLPIAIGLALWELTCEKIIGHLRPEDGSLIVNYDQLIEDKAEQLPGLIRFISRGCTSDEMQRHLAELSPLIKPRLDHSDRSKEIGLTPRQTYLREVLLSGVIPSDHHASKADSARVEELFTVYREAKMIRPKTSKTGQLYYTRGKDEFRELDSIICITEDGRLSFRFRSPIPVSRLRFDPDEDHAVIRMKDIRFFKGGEPLEIPHALQSNGLNDDEGTLYFTTDDPNVEIVFHESVPVEMDRVDIDVEYLASGQPAVERLVGFLEQGYLQGLSRTRELEDRLSMASAESAEQMHQLIMAHGQARATLSAELASSTAENQRLREEIERRDVQARKLEAMVRALRDSRSYRLGNALLKPFRNLRP